MIVDVERLLVTMLGAALPGLHVVADIESDTWDPVTGVPLVAVKAFGGVPDGSAQDEVALQEWRVQVSVVAAGRDASREVAVDVLAAVQGLDGYGAGVLPGVGMVESVTVQELPTIGSQATVNARRLTQWDATYQLVVSQA